MNQYNVKIEFLNAFEGEYRIVGTASLPFFASSTKQLRSLITHWVKETHSVDHFEYELIYVEENIDYADYEDTLILKKIENCCQCEQPTPREQLVIMPSDDIVCKNCYVSKCWHDSGNRIHYKSGGEVITCCEDCGQEI